MEKDLVSIIVPVYNAEKFLDDTINSVLKQTYSNFELLLINDGSTDNSKTVFNKYKNDKRIKWFDQKENGGAALARNRGIKEAKGHFLCFLDADDLWDICKLERQIDFMKENNCAFSYHSYEFADENGVPNGKKVFSKEQLCYNDALKNNIISTITVMFDLSLIKKSLIMMPNLKYVEDTATWWQVLRNGYIAYGIPNLFSYYRRIPNSNSSNKLRTQKSLWHLYRKVEKLSFFRALYCLTWKNIHAVLRRI